VVAILHKAMPKAVPSPRQAKAVSPKLEAAASSAASSSKAGGFMAGLVRRAKRPRATIVEITEYRSLVAEEEQCRQDIIEITQKIRRTSGVEYATMQHEREQLKKSLEKVEGQIERLCKQFDGLMSEAEAPSATSASEADPMELESPSAAAASVGGFPAAVPQPPPPLPPRGLPPNEHANLQRSVEALQDTELFSAVRVERATAQVAALLPPPPLQPVLVESDGEGDIPPPSPGLPYSERYLSEDLQRSVEALHDRAVQVEQAAAQAEILLPPPPLQPAPTVEEPYERCKCVRGRHMCHNTRVPRPRASFCHLCTGRCLCNCPGCEDPGWYGCSEHKDMMQNCAACTQLYEKREQKREQAAASSRPPVPPPSFPPQHPALAGSGVSSGSRAAASASEGGFPAAEPSQVPMEIKEAAEQPDGQSDTDSEGRAEGVFPARGRVAHDDFWSSVNDFDPDFNISDVCESLPANHFERWTNRDGRYLGTYVRGGRGHPDVNKSWAADTVYKYVDWVTDLKPRIRMDDRDPQDRFPPFQSITECVQTLCQMCQHPQAAFGWVTPKLAYVRTMEETWERLPPQAEFVMRSKKPMPMHLLQPAGPEHGPEVPKYYDDQGRAHVLHKNVVKKYHGTDFPSFLAIASDGLAPSPCDTGCERCWTHLAQHPRWSTLLTTGA